MQALSIVQQALVITVIGVVLIFVVLFVLWGLMAGLVRVTAPRAKLQDETGPVAIGAEAQIPAPVATGNAARRAAVAAVAVALALAAHADRASSPVHREQGPISPWQATIRGNAMSRHAGVFRRNPPPRKS